jgi:hypothetical protein
MHRLALRIVTIAVLGVAPLAAPVGAQTAPDREAVRQAALDYVEGIYQAQPDRIRRSVHPNLVKRGFFKKSPEAPYAESPMTFDQLVKLASEWNKDGKQSTSIKDVAVLDVLDQTAVAKVTATWGIDYMLLGKYDGRWQIIQILWQSHPPKTTR